MSKNNHHTGKSVKNSNIAITLDSNMVAYLYVLSSSTSSEKALARVSEKLKNSELKILIEIIKNDFKGINFYTTPQVILEITRYAQLNNDPNIISFLTRICKIHLPSSSTTQYRYAELIYDLMTAYSTKNIPLNTATRELHSAIFTGKQDEPRDFADALITAQNNILNGTPLITDNEKHLISINLTKILDNKRKYIKNGTGKLVNTVSTTNRLRSLAILRINKEFLKANKYRIKNKNIRANLQNPRSTTYRILDLPELLSE